MRKALLAIVTGLLATLLGAGPALACGGLIGRNGSVNLVKTTTLVGTSGRGMIEPNSPTYRPAWSAAGTGPCSASSAR